jgi:hypothetical protein
MFAAWSGMASTVHWLADNHMRDQEETADTTRIFQEASSAPDLSLRQAKASARTQIVVHKNVREEGREAASGGEQLYASDLQWDIRCHVLQTARF